MRSLLLKQSFYLAVRQRLLIFAIRTSGFAYFSRKTYEALSASQVEPERS
ncbi:hypothetical protein [Acinetobacter courvalinii]